MITVFIPTYNPNIIRLNQALQGLKTQSLPLSKWELIIVDNNSTIAFHDQIDLSWHPSSKIIEEKKQGLTFARLAGFEVAKNDILVMVDDDNILDSNYLSHVSNIFNTNNSLGAIGGKSIPLFEAKEPVWLKEFYDCLALRDLGNNKIIGKWNKEYPNYSPIGAGMALRKSSLSSYIKKIKNGISDITDRKGNSLSSGGDNDIVLEILKSGWHVGYFPELSLQHIIPENRMKPKYLAKLNHDSYISWIKLLHNHNLNNLRPISKFTYYPRIIKSFFKTKPWINPANYIKWIGACGVYKAQLNLKK